MVEAGNKKITDPKKALEKARAWCAYQERCQQEVRDKLYTYGLWPEAVENIIASLISENFLNEERFAIAFAGGKFRIKKWGRVRITLELKKRKVSPYCIKQALLQVEGEAYHKTLQEVFEKALRTCKEKHHLKKKYYVMNTLLRRGFEQDLVSELVNQLD